LYLHFALGWLNDYDLDLLVHELSPIKTEWEALGWALNLPEEDLKTTGKRCRNPFDCLRETLQQWLKDREVKNWWLIVKSLQSIGKDRLSNILKKKYGELSTKETSLLCTDSEIFF